MISLSLTDIKGFMSQLLLSETFDNFSFIEGEIVTFNTFRIDGFIQKDFFDTEEEPPQYSCWKNLREYCFSIIRGKRTPLSFQPFPGKYQTPDGAEHSRTACGRRPGPLSEHPL